MFSYLAVKTHLYALVNSKYFHLEPFWNHLICKLQINVFTTVHKAHTNEPCYLGIPNYPFESLNLIQSYILTCFDIMRVRRKSIFIITIMEVKQKLNS